jgi:hypothetical protein
MAGLFALPIGFWISFLLLAGLALRGWVKRREAWGIPSAVVCGTVLIWYHGDAVYNGYADLHSRLFSRDVLDAAWWQVTSFALALAVFAPGVHRQVNRRFSGATSVAAQFIDERAPTEVMQRAIRLTLRGLVITWTILTVIALVRTSFDWQGLFFPWMGHKALPWGRARTGSGIEFLLSLAQYVDIFCAAGFGVTAVLTRDRKVRSVALLLLALSWPGFIFDRTRNTMLAVVLPSFLCLVFFRLRRRPMAQILVTACAFAVVQAWFAFVLAARTEQSVAQAFAGGKFSTERARRHLGLNMFEELCWINKFLEEGTYRPNWGYRYYCELVNPIPRTLWRGKPLIGIDYAIVRGQSTGRNPNDVYATISTGMIGQGVVNFGAWMGPVFAALLASGWVAVLARFDLTGHRVGRLALYMLGLVLTFNMGRDITLLVSYPLLCGYVIVRGFEGMRGSGGRQGRPSLSAEASRRLGIRRDSVSELH